MKFRRNMDLGPPRRLQAMDRSTRGARDGSQRSQGASSRRLVFTAVSLTLFVAGALVLRASIVHAGSAPRSEPLIQRDKLVGGDVAEAAGVEAHFGSSTALSSDGGTLVVGAPGDDKARGAAWVFTRDGEAWTPQSGGELLPGEVLPGTGGEACAPGSEACEECAEEPQASPPEEGECAFGASVAVSADGETAIVGNPTTSGSPGAAWVFTREGASWTRTAELTGGESLGEGRFGKSVALSADGDLALVGDPSAKNGRGSASLFAREGSSWTPLGSLSVEESAFAHFGRSVALSADGSLALIGAPGEDEFAGAAWTFARSGSVWTRQHNELVEEGAQPGDHFGKSVALSADGGTALIGALEAEGGRGAVSPFTVSAEGLVAQGPKLVGTEGELHFGASVALSGDGDFALVGAPRATASGGTVTELARAESTWVKKHELLSASGARSRAAFGAAVALSSDGKVATIGSPREDGRAGAAWMFVEGQPPPPAIEGVVPRSGSTAGGESVTIKGENFGEVESVTFAGVKAESASSTSATEIAAVTPPGAAGKVEVTVTTPGGKASLQRAFVYETPPGAPGPGGGPGPGPGPSGGGSGASGGSTGAGGVHAAGAVAGSTSSADAACSLSLRKKRLAVTRYRTVALRLMRTGAGTCRGKLAISYRVKAKGRGDALRTMGTASFAIAAGHSKVVDVELTKAGQAWFRAHRGAANASLAIARVVPAPTMALSASVRLSSKRTRQRSLAK